MADDKKDDGKAKTQDGGGKPAAERTPDEGRTLVHGTPRGVLRDYLETIVICVLVLLFARTFVFMQSKIPTESMLDTLLVGDYILVDRNLYAAPGDSPAGLLGQREIRRGDVVVFKFPEDPDVDFVKRVIGLPGETVEMKDGRMLVDGRPLEEPYVLPENVDPQANYGPAKVPPGQYFMMGDNRANSRDSRYWGFLPRSLVKGRAFFIWYSFEEQRNDQENVGLRRLQSIARKIYLFPTRTRWGRLFSIIR
ncbi:MAG TPA: signal peptidase I [Acidobacteriota bacterium]|nr:signal peptidase I [bacterium]HNX19303.1 signal peptidase I [Acidobacteriota bacterium]